MSSSTSPIESAFQPLHQGSATNSNISSPLCNSDSTSTNDATSSRPNLPSQMLRRNLLSSQHFASPTDNLMSPCSAKLQAHKYKYLTKGKPATTLSFGKPSSGGSLKSSSSLKDSSSPL